MGPDETVEGLTLLSVDHSIQLMHTLSNERKFGNIIEAARSTKDWKQLRAYLNVFQEYFTYLSVRAEDPGPLPSCTSCWSTGRATSALQSRRPHRSDHRPFPPGLPQRAARRCAQRPGGGGALHPCGSST